MRSLSAREIIDIWERGQGKRMLDIAMLMLTTAFPNRPPEELAAIPIGERDASLLTLREQTLGSDLQATVSCDNCGERLEITTNVNELRVHNPETKILAEQQIKIGDVELRYQIPDSWDLAFIRNFQDIETARYALISRCVLEANINGEAIPPQSLPEEVISHLEDVITANDPQAELLFDTVCPVCETRSETLFDIVSFLWAELSVVAQRLLTEVHELARIYGWSETEILNMSAARRNFYLEMTPG